MPTYATYRTARPSRAPARTPSRAPSTTSSHHSTASAHTHAYVVRAAAAPQSAVSTSSLPLTPAESSLLAHHQRLTTPAAPPNTLLIDPTSLHALGSHLDRLLATITARLDHLSVQAQAGVARQQSHAARTIEEADREIARFKEVLRQIDELEVEFDKVRRVGEIVKGYRGRVEGLERRFA